MQFCVFTLAQRGIRTERWERADNGGRAAFAEALARARPGTSEAKGKADGLSLDVERILALKVPLSERAWGCRFHDACEGILESLHVQQEYLG